MNVLNPLGAGRPKGRLTAATERHRRHLGMLCREFTEEAVNTLIEIMQDKTVNPAARVRAAENILDRGYGKAPQQLVIDLNEDKPLSEMSDEELLAIVADNRDDVHVRLQKESDELDEWDDHRDQA